MPLMLACIKLKITLLVHKHVVPLPKMIKARTEKKFTFKANLSKIILCTNSNRSLSYA